MADYTHVEKMKLSDGKTYNVGLRNININEKGNLNIETSAELGNTTKGKINIESMDDIQLKPGDDIIFYSHHRAAGNHDEVKLKATNGDDVPVKLQINVANLTLSTKDKDLTKIYSDDSKPTSPTGSTKDDEILDLNITTGKSSGNKKGYLKVRARAIDLRCEEHGGIALQPKGRDSSGKMNKIKFEHGGGDGLEFGTFNTEKSSLFTDEYRFNKYGLVKMATRETERSPKYDGSDNTTWEIYKKQSDDFYDVIDSDDEVCDWKSIIKTGNAFNFGKNRHAKATSKGHIEIETCASYKWQIAIDDPEAEQLPSKELFKYQNYGDEFNDGDAEDGGFTVDVSKTYRTADGKCVQAAKTDSPKIQLTSGNDMEITSTGKTVVTSGKSIEIVSDKSIEVRSGNTSEIDVLTGAFVFQHKKSAKNKIQGGDAAIKFSVENNGTEGEWEGLQMKESKSYSVTVKDLIKAVQYIKSLPEFASFNIQEDLE